MCDPRIEELRAEVERLRRDLALVTRFALGLERDLALTAKVALSARSYLPVTADEIGRVREIALPEKVTV